jgi:vanadium chloroperoxidase
MDHILYWNEVALEANRRDFTDIPPGQTPGKEKPMPEQGGPTLSSRALAIVHLAMYDAHAAIVGGPGLPRYLVGGPTPGAGLNASEAVAGAASRTLSALYPRQADHFNAAVAGAGVSGNTPSFLFGRAVGQAMLTDRACDPGASDAGYAPSPAHYHHRPDPMNPTQGFHAPFYGASSKCFATQTRHGIGNPVSAANLPMYRRALKHVRVKGIKPELMGTLDPTLMTPIPLGTPRRTDEETMIGLYWAYDGAQGLGTPPRLYNLIVREVSKAQNSLVDDNARLFALVNAAMGDAGILAWEQKYLWDLWRPVVGIREDDASMGSLGIGGSTFSADCDPSWLPMAAPATLGDPQASTLPATRRDFTPNFPAYPSGHATFGAAALHMTRMFYGEKPESVDPDSLFPMEFVSGEMSGIAQDTAGNVRPRHTREFPRGLWQMIEENGFSRVYLGVHWFIDAFALKDGCDEPDLSKNIGGVPLGLEIAKDIWAYGGGKGPKKSTV